MGEHLAADTGTRATVVIGNEDGGSGQLRVYAGKKEKSGSPVDRAGLTNGVAHRDRRRSTRR